MVNSAQGYLLEFRDKHKEQSTNWGSTDSAPRLPTKHLLARLNPQPVHIVVMGTRRLNIYCCSEQNGQQNASVTSVVRLTSQMCSRTMKVVEFLISSGYQCPHIGSTWRARHDNNNNNNIIYWKRLPNNLKTWVVYTTRYGLSVYLPNYQSAITSGLFRRSNCC